MSRKPPKALRNLPETFCGEPRGVFVKRVILEVLRGTPSQKASHPWLSMQSKGTLVRKLVEAGEEFVKLPIDMLVERGIEQLLADGSVTSYEDGLDPAHAPYGGTVTIYVFKTVHDRLAETADDE